MSLVYKDMRSGGRERWIGGKEMRIGGKMFYLSLTMRSDLDWEQESIQSFDLLGK